MPCRMEAHLGTIKLQRLAIGYRLRALGEFIAVAQTHDVQRFLGRQHSAMASAGMVGMPMCDQRLFNRPRRIDMKAAGFAAHAGWRRNKDVFGTHRA